MRLPSLRKIRSLMPRRGAFSWRHAVRNLILLGLWCVTLGVIGVSLFIIYAKNGLPDPNSIISRQVKESTKIYDRTGKTILYDIYGEERRTVVSWDAISETMKKATLAAEDSGFYEHPGFDLKGIVRSIVRDIQSGSSAQGGSTITQQLVGNALVGRQKGGFTGIKRKVQELILAVEVEQRFSKDEIFGMYLNQVPYGSNAYGVEAAARTFFGVPASDLTLGQAAVLASLPQRPSYLSPYGTHLADLTGRKEYVLNRMVQLGYINSEQYEQAKQEQITFKPLTTALVAPHFVLMARQYMIDKYGKDIVETGGFKIITTLDADLQKQAEATVTKYAAINKQKYHANNAALVAIDPKTGEVRALVGSADYFDTENQGNYNVVTAQRQPGSAFKPFAYAYAFSKGFPDTTILWDEPTEFNPLCPPDSSKKYASNGTACYHPKNYDGKYFGPITMRESLAESRNTTAVQTLYLAGIDNVLDLATKMGITTLSDRSRFGLALVLGGAEVRPIDLASAYGVFANDGIHLPWGLIQQVETSDGTILEQRHVTGERALDAQTSRLMSDVLSDNAARAREFGINNSLVIPGRKIAAKTGTTQEGRDAWVVGYTPSLVTAVWTGNNDNTPMSAAGAGISAAGPMWNAFMSLALRGTPVESFLAPDPLLTNKIMLNGSYTSDIYPQPHSILYYVNKNDPLGPIPSPQNDTQFPNWEWTVRAHTGGI